MRGTSKKKLKKKQSARLQIIKLIEDGFFDKSKMLSEIQKELANRGFIYKITSLFPVIYRQFVRDGIIKRRKKEDNRTYLYFVEIE